MSDIKTIEGSLRGKRYKPDMQFDFVISIPEKEVGEYALLVNHDGQSDANVRSMLSLADALYIKTEQGVYRRALREDCTDFASPQRKYAGYYD